ncbi:MAG: peptidylprolyl isomerase, partial [Planctomycetia bacterium]
REAAELAPPWDNQPVARARGVEIGVNDFVRLLRRRLEPSAVQNAAYQTLLERKVLERLPDAAPGRIEEYVQKEIERRRREAQADPKNKGVPFERLMAAQGLSVASLPLDPGLRVSALSKLWIDKAYSAEALKRAYADERKLYDDAYGEAVELSMIFLTGARFTNPLNPRSIDDAMASLAKLAREIPSFEEFQKRAAELSEDEASRKAKGGLGFVTPTHPRLPAELRELLQKRLASSPTPEQLRGEGLVGPISVSNGAVLLWLGQRRPAPTWEVMSGYVQRELRRRFLEEALPRASVSYSL